MSVGPPKPGLTSRGIVDTGHPSLRASKVWMLEKEKEESGKRRRGGGREFTLEDNLLNMQHGVFATIYHLLVAKNQDSNLQGRKFLHRNKQIRGQHFLKSNPSHVYSQCANQEQ